MIEELLRDLVERLDHRYFGKYRGYVTDVDDPLQLGRIRAIVPRLLGEDTPTGWALPCAPYAGPDQGFFTVPDVGAGVWIEFEGGDLSRPIWTGGWWGRPEADDVDQDDSTAREHRVTPETPRHQHDPVTATPQVRIFKSSTGHHIVLDDRPEHERIEIHDSRGNRLILSKEGLDRILGNERTFNKGGRAADIRGSDRTTVSGEREMTVGQGVRETTGGNHTRTIGGNLVETAGSGAYVRTIDHSGLAEVLSGSRATSISGADVRTVSGAIQETAVGGYGLTAAGPVNIASGGTVKIGAGLPDLSLNAVSLDALAGNISINTMLGMMRLGGMTAISPLVLGDGLAMHFTMESQIAKAFNPLTVMAYGPAMDIWAAMTPVMDFSYFGFVKRFPVG